MRRGAAIAAIAVAASACSAAPRIEPCDRLVALAERVVDCDQLAAAPRDKVAAGLKILKSALADLDRLGGAEAVPPPALAELSATCAKQDAEHRATYAKVAPACVE